MNSKIVVFISQLLMAQPIFVRCSFPVFGFRQQWDKEITKKSRFESKSKLRSWAYSKTLAEANTRGSQKRDHLEF